MACVDKLRALNSADGSSLEHDENDSFKMIDILTCGSSLSLLRRLTSLRISWRTKRAVQSELRGIARYFEKHVSQGWELSRDFVAAGGAKLAVEVVGCKPCAEGLRLLRALSRFGREWKEHICECDIMSRLVAAALSDTPHALGVWEGAWFELAVELHVGNPVHAASLRNCVVRLLRSGQAGAQLCGIKIVRAVVSIDSPNYDPGSALAYRDTDFGTALVATLLCQNEQVSSAASSLLQQLLPQAVHMHEPVIRCIVASLDETDESGSRCSSGCGAAGRALEKAKILGCTILSRLVLASLDLRLVFSCLLDRALVNILADRSICHQEAKTVSPEVLASVAKLLSVLYDNDFDGGPIHMMLSTIFRSNVDLLAKLVWNPEGFNDMLLHDLDVATKVRQGCLEYLAKSEIPHNDTPIVTVHPPIFLTESTQPDELTVNAPRAPHTAPLPSQRQDLPLPLPTIGFEQHNRVITRLKKKSRLRGEFRLTACELGMTVHAYAHTWPSVRQNAVNEDSPTVHPPASNKVKVTSSVPQGFLRNRHLRPTGRRDSGCDPHNNGIVGIIGICAPEYDL